LLRGHCQTDMRWLFGDVFFLFQQDVDRPAHRAREYHRFPVATAEMRETHRRLGTCVLERGAHLEHEF